MSAASNSPIKPFTVLDFATARERGRKITVLTAYDYLTARLLDAAGVDVLLVGDSLGMVVQGRQNCLQVTMDDMVYHTQLVSRGIRRAMLVADMPFLSYQISSHEAVRNAGRLVQQAGAHAVKLEGGRRSLEAIRAILSAEIPVMGHVGMTPQSVHRFGGFKVQRQAEIIVDEAKALHDAGVFAIVVECVPAAITERIRDAIATPLIGIGAGPGCDGQVLVTPDMLGLVDDLRPKFARRYAELGQAIRDAATRYCQDVQSGQFPTADESYR